MRTARRQKQRRRRVTVVPRVPPMPFTPFSTAWMAAEAAHWPEHDAFLDACPCCLDMQAQQDDNAHYRTVYPDLYALDYDRYGNEWDNDYYDRYYDHDDDYLERDHDRDALCDAYAPYDRYMDEQTAWFEALFAAEDAARALDVAPVPPVRQLARSGVTTGKRWPDLRTSPRRGFAKRLRARAQRRAARWAVVESAAVG